MKILIAVDGSPHTERMLAYLQRHSNWFASGNEYTVVHSVAAVPAGAANLLGKDDLKSYYDGEAERVFAPVRAFFAAQGWPASFVAKIGPAGDNISNLANQGGFDLLVMGSHGHGTFGKLMLGSVATRVMAQCSTAVLIVR